MTEFGEYRKMVLDKVLTDLFFTEQEGPHDYMSGISPAYYFSTIMELNQHEKLRLGNDFITEWNEEQPIIKLTNKNWNLPENLIFTDQKITDLTQDEYGRLALHLENGTMIYHTIDYGDQLFIENETINPG